MKVNDVIIVGAGPAGISAAIQLKRYGVEPILLEKSKIGGLLKNANLVENYPGFPNGIPGIKLVGLFKKQLENNQIKIDFENVFKVNYKENLFFVETNKRERISRILIIATGTIPVPFPDLSILNEMKERVFYEIYPIMKVENEEIVIVGGGDAAFDYALNLSKKNKVTILVRSEKPKCLPLLEERVNNSKNISYLTNTILEKINFSNNVLLLKCRSDHEEIILQASYLVIAIGRQPLLDFLDRDVIAIRDELERQGKLFLIGDVKNGIYRQTSIAVGDGIKTAMKIYKKLKEEEL
jgi:thioredoxin reductase